jgi:molybdenum cofactor biosynthesis enzyme MoaA
MTGKNSIGKKEKKSLDELRIQGTDRLCYAPFNNINFNIFGRASACCENFRCESDARDANIEKLWNGKHFRTLRKRILNDDLGYGCGFCLSHLKEERPAMALLHMFDRVPEVEKLPLQMEFEIDAECPLECVMCTGDLSSAIRRNRDLLPPRPSLYGKEFFTNLRPLLQNLKYATFNGGEPFVSPVCQELWEIIAQNGRNPRIAVTTSGTVLNQRIKSVMESANFDITVSFESLRPEIYESIRKNASFRVLMENIGYFREYSEKKNTMLSVSACPLRENVAEMYDLLLFCNERNMDLHLQTVAFPFSHALWSLDEKSLMEVMKEVSRPLPPVRNSVSERNNRRYADFLNLLRSWTAKAHGRSWSENGKGGRMRDRCFSKIEKYVSENFTEGGSATMKIIKRLLIEQTDSLPDSILQRIFASPKFKGTERDIFQKLITDGISAELRFATLREFYNRTT